MAEIAVAVAVLAPVVLLILFGWALHENSKMLEALDRERRRILEDLERDE